MHWDRIIIIIILGFLFYNGFCLIGNEKDAGFFTFWMLLLALVVLSILWGPKPGEFYHDNGDSIF